MSQSRLIYSLLQALLAFGALFLVSIFAACSGTGSGKPSDSESLDTFRVVNQRYSDGRPRRVLYRVGTDSSTAKPVQQQTLSPSGRLLKVYRPKTGNILYYHDIHSKFDSSEGLQRFLQGMWLRTKPVVKYKRFKNAPVDFPLRVKANNARTFRGDTLIITRYVVLQNPKTRKPVKRSAVEVGFKVDFRPPNYVILQRALYRRRPDTSQVLKNMPLIPAKLRGRVVDTVRVYSPDRFQIMTSAPSPSGKIYKRHLDVENLPGTLPKKLQRIREGQSSAGVR